MERHPRCQPECQAGNRGICQRGFCILAIVSAAEGPPLSDEEMKRLRRANKPRVSLGVKQAPGRR